jgi:hypothetical protein
MALPSIGSDQKKSKKPSLEILFHRFEFAFIARGQVKTCEVLSTCYYIKHVVNPGLRIMIETEFKARQSTHILKHLPLGFGTKMIDAP